MIELPSTWDGATGPVYRFTLKDDGATVDAASAAVEYYVYDEAGTLVSRRPGRLVSPKSGGQVDLQLLGRDVDWAGLGKNLVIKPKLYLATTPDGAAATNLLLNPSFDSATGTSPNRVPDSWTVVGTPAATYDNHNNFQWPPTIFGTAQYVKHATTADTDYFEQGAAITAVAGDRLSAGIWHRTMPPTGSGDLSKHVLNIRYGALAGASATFPVGAEEWKFYTASTVATAAQSAWTMKIDFRGTTQTNLVDDAFVFVGDWRVPDVEPMRLKVKARPRPTNRIAGIGGFEYDTNGDGLPDGWRFSSAGTNTYALDANPNNSIDGAKSLQVTLAAASGKGISTIHRGRFNAGDTWRAKVFVKTNGSLTGSPSAGDFAIRVSTDTFDGDTLAQESTPTDFGTFLFAFTEYATSLTLTEDVGALRVELMLNTVTGTAWFDGVVLEKV